MTPRTRLLTAVASFAALLLPGSRAAAGQGPTTVYDLQAETIDGETVSLSDFKGKVLLIVNSASRCGFTPQYAGLEELWERYRDQGLVVLAFPSNDFANQDPGTNDEIAQFCKARYDVSFPLFAKVKVRGDEQHPLFRALTDGSTNPDLSGPIRWNFHKFLVGRDGKLVARFGSMTKPTRRKLTKAVEAALAVAAPQGPDEDAEPAEAEPPAAAEGEPSEQRAVLTF
jgi:glutathione peroxidase